MRSQNSEGHPSTLNTELFEWKRSKVDMRKEIGKSKTLYKSILIIGKTMKLDEAKVPTRLPIIHAVCNEAKYHWQ